MPVLELEWRRCSGTFDAGVGFEDLDGSNGAYGGGSSVFCDIEDEGGFSLATWSANELSNIGGNLLGGLTTPLGRGRFKRFDVLAVFLGPFGGLEDLAGG